MVLPSNAMRGLASALAAEPHISTRSGAGLRGLPCRAGALGETEDPLCHHSRVVQRHPLIRDHGHEPQFPPPPCTILCASTSIITSLLGACRAAIATYGGPSDGSSIR